MQDVCTIETCTCFKFEGLRAQTQVNATGAKRHVCKRALQLE